MFQTRSPLTAELVLYFEIPFVVCDCLFVFTSRKFHGSDKMDCLAAIQRGKVEIVVTTYETFREHQVWVYYFLFFLSEKDSGFCCVTKEKYFQGNSL